MLQSLPPLLSATGRRIGLMACVLLAVTVSASSAAEPLHVRIDKLLDLRPFGPAAARCTDAEFLRRTSLNLIATIPTAVEARAFLADKSPDKRAKLITALLSRPEYIQRMTDFYDVTFMERRRDKHIKGPEWRTYLYDSVAADKPYNQLAREILGSDGADAKLRAAGKFYLDRDAEPNQLTRDVGRVFFGKDFQCAQCHDHPIVENYLQSDYYGLYAFLNRTYLFADKKKKKSFLAEKTEGVVGFTSVFTKTSGRTLPQLPGGPQLDEPVYPAGLDVIPTSDGSPAKPKYSRRERLATEATSGGNRAFNRNIVNRLWRMMMGRGLVEPVDFHHPDNPASHPELLDLLAEELARTNYDVRSFLGEIARTEIYQRSFELPAEFAAGMGNLAQRIAHWEAEHKRLDAVRLQFGKRVTAVEAELKPLKSAVEKIEDELAKVNAASTAEEKKAAPARKALATATAQLTAKQTALAAVNAVLAKTALLAKQLPADKEIAAVHATFAKKAAQFTKEVATLNTAVAQKQAAMKPFDDKFAVSRKNAEAVIAKLKTARQQSAPVDQRLAAAMREWKAIQTAVKTVGNQLAFAASFRDYTVAAQKLTSQDAQLAPLANRQSELQKQVAATSTRIQTMRPSVTALESQKAAAENSVTKAGKQLADTQAVVKKLAAALKQAEAAKTALPKDAELAKAIATLAVKTTAYQKTAADNQNAVSAQQAMLTAITTKRDAAAKALQSEMAALSTQQSELRQHTAKFSPVQSQREKQNAAVEVIHAKLTQQLTERFAIRPLQPLTPEQFAYCMLTATGVTGQYRQVELNALKKKNPKFIIPTDAAKRADYERQISQAITAKLQNNVKFFVGLFGAGAGQPQDEFFATVDQTLFLSNSGQVRGWLNPAGENLTARLLKLQDAQAIADELYLSVFTRRPTPAESDDVKNYLTGREKDRLVALQELAWGLLTSAEFRFNH